MISAKIKKLNIKKKKFSLFSILVCTIVPLIASCSTSPLKENVVSIDLKNGEERYINLQTKVGLATYRVIPVLAGPEKGKREIQNCKFDKDF